MSVYQHILVALDGSDQSEKAFHEAVRIAKEEQATLYLATLLMMLNLRRVHFLLKNCMI